MNAGPTFVPHIEAAKTMEPGQRAFHDPPRATEPTAMRRAALGELGLDPAALQRVAMRLRVVTPVSLNQARLAQGAPRTAAERRNGVDEGQQLGDVVPVGAGQDGRQRDPARVGEEMVLRPRLTAIGWVRSSCFPPRSARTEPLSTRARVRSNSPRWRNSASSTACSRHHTPARCHRTSRASTYGLTHTPVPSGACAKESHCATRRESRSRRPDPGGEADPWPSSGGAAASVTAARFASIRHRR